MSNKELTQVGRWLNTQGWDINLKDEFWMEEFLEDVKFKDLAEMLLSYKDSKGECIKIIEGVVLKVGKFSVLVDEKVEGGFVGRNYDKELFYKDVAKGDKVEIKKKETRYGSLVRFDKVS